MSSNVGGHRHLTGREDNIFWRRVPGGHGGKLEAVGARVLCAKDADPLGENIIHSVTNPIARLTGAIHVYGGDFFGAERSEWDPETLKEARYDAAQIMPCPPIQAERSGSAGPLAG